jgi:hypothetical protein
MITATALMLAQCETIELLKSEGALMAKRLLTRSADLLKSYYFGTL